MDLNPKTRGRKRLFQHLGRGFWVSFLVACAIAFLGDVGVERLVNSGELPDVTQSIFNLSGFYQRIVASPRNPIARYVEIVKIDPQSDSSAVALTDICEQREMMTTLLDSVARALPRVIVLDKYYSPHAPRPCPADSQLIQTVRSLRANNISVIIGRRISDESIAARSDSRYYLLPGVAFYDRDPCIEPPDARGTNCLEGVLNIDPDTRKLPLEWAVFPSKNDAEGNSGQRWRDTLALSAARAYDDKLLTHHPRLASLLNSKEHPYISFLKKEDFDECPVSRVLPSAFHTNPSTGGNADEVLAPELRKLSGKIVLIGEINNDMDVHASVVGKLPGMYMQANYIEALLDDRYFRPIPVLDYMLGFLIVAALELILVLFGNSWWKAFLLIAGLLVSTVILLYLLVKIPGWYVNPLSVGVIAVMLKLLQPMTTRMDGAAKV
jgi:CHASE2 domain-containing sensor protein